MLKTKSIQTGRINLFVKDFVELTKFRLGSLVVFSSVIALYVVSGGQASIMTYGLLAVGGFLVSGAASALNEVFEKDYDGLMTRTMDRPIPSGRMTSTEAVFYAGLMSLFGIGTLALINPITAFLATLSLVLYAFLYTPFKRFSNIAVLIGAIPGAFPLLIGGVAFQGVITTEAIGLFGMQFFWQFGHFWAIAWIGDADYKKAGFKLLPFDGQKTSRVGLLGMVSCIPMILLSLLPFRENMNSQVALLLVIGCGTYFMYMNYRLYRDANDFSARKLMYASFVYLPIVLLAQAWNV